MKHLLSILVMLAIVLSLFSSATPVFATSSPLKSQSSLTEYHYPITPDSDDWNYYTVTEKVIMLQIPESTLATMTDVELIAALASYPYLIDIYLYGSSVQDGVDIVKTYCSALNELLKRDSDLGALLDYLSTEPQTVYNKDNFRLAALRDIYLSQVADSNVSTCASSNAKSYVTTPKGTSVEVITALELDSTSEHECWDDEALRTYGAELIEPGTCLYNCHYYAWHLKGDIESDTLRCMLRPGAYMTDGSYTRTYTGNMNAPHYATSIRNGDIIHYGTIDDTLSSHSAICIETSVTSNTIKNITCISKWGTLGIFKHKLGNVPTGYDTSTVSAWRLS